jgi:hypothetical protein
MNYNLKYLFELVFLEYHIKLKFQSKNFKLFHLFNIVNILFNILRIKKLKFKKQNYNSFLNIILKKNELKCKIN